MANNDHDPTTTIEQPAPTTEGDPEQQPFVTPEQPSEQPQPQPMPPADTVQHAREMVPIDESGTISAANYSHIVTRAKDMAKAYLQLPSHLHDNVPVCVGLVELAYKFGFVPFMVASKTYVHKGRSGQERLSYESQFFIAVAMRSGEIHGSLDYEWEGEGQDLRCTVSGRLNADPEKVKVWRGRTLGQLHPGHSTKDGTQYVRGSQLWDRKPELQLAYDAGRDWVRLHCPGAVMGLYTPEELHEYDDRDVIDVEPVKPLSVERLQSEGLGSAEGYDGGMLDSEMARMRPAPHAVKAPAPSPRRRGRPPKRQAARGGSVTAPKTTTKSRRGRPPTKAVVKAVADRAERRSRERATLKPELGKLAQDYIKTTKEWIASTIDPEAAIERWENEHEVRDELMVPIKIRLELRDHLDHRVKEIKARL